MFFGSSKAKWLHYALDDGFSAKSSWLCFSTCTWISPLLSGATSAPWPILCKCSKR